MQFKKLSLKRKLTEIEHFVFFLDKRRDTSFLAIKMSLQIKLIKDDFIR
jgi:hypothetical protein